MFVQHCVQHVMNFPIVPPIASTYPNNVNSNQSHNMFMICKHDATNLRCNIVYNKTDTRQNNQYHMQRNNVACSETTNLCGEITSLSKTGSRFDIRHIENWIRFEIRKKKTRTASGLTVADRGFRIAGRGSMIPDRQKHRDRRFTVDFAYSVEFDNSTSGTAWDLPVAKQLPCCSETTVL